MSAAMSADISPENATPAEDFFKRLSLPPEDVAAVHAAWDCLFAASTGITRKDGTPFWLHPLRVATILAENNLDRATIIAALFHGLPGQGLWNEADMSARFGGEVCKLIASEERITGFGVTNKKTLHKGDSLQKMLFALADDVRVIILKLAERLDAIRYGKDYDDEGQRLIGQEAIDIWAPLANRLGMSSFKSEFEDLGLKFTNPNAFQQVKKLVALKKSEREDYLLRAQKEIYRIASRAGIAIEVSSRAKHFYSIYQKMRKRGKEADGIYDLLALRIITGTQGDCYAFLGIVHGNWKPLDGRFKDYIAMPKANGYQSLHTTVIFDGKPLEIQIRTKDMHSVAEHGVASHWLYKQRIPAALEPAAPETREPAIIKKLKELKDEHLQDEQLFAAIRAELLGDSIFLFTPKGDVKELPRGATAIDFAYAIHSAIGEKIVGAKADGRIIPLAAPLKNTQIIEILTNPQAHPTMNQLQMVKTARSRAKIRAYLAAVGEQSGGGSLPPAPKPTASPLPPLRGDTPRNAPKTRESPPDSRVPAPPSTSSVCIGNNSNFMVTFAKCCRPTHDDAIVGYVSRGRGLIVHRADCPSLRRNPNSSVRSIDAHWEAAASK